MWYIQYPTIESKSFTVGKFENCDLANRVDNFRANGILVSIGSPGNQLSSGSGIVLLQILPIEFVWLRKFRAVQFGRSIFRQYIQSEPDGMSSYGIFAV